MVIWAISQTHTYLQIHLRLIASFVCRNVLDNLDYLQTISSSALVILKKVLSSLITGFLHSRQVRAFAPLAGTKAF